jgi:hypothetical protein
MPTISKFYGILIQMYFGDHVPPHFHALYAEFEALSLLQNSAFEPSRLAEAVI